MIKKETLIGHLLKSYANIAASLSPYVGIIQIRLRVEANQLPLSRLSCQLPGNNIT